MAQSILVDNFGRLYNYLRVSVTDRCNLRCVYCMGAQGIPLLNRNQILRHEEILEVIRVGAKLGINRIRLTGGEPLVRRNLLWLIRQIRDISEITDISLTTNGIFLEENAVKLREAGLNRVNVSLDSLNRAVFSQITRGGDLNRVLSGIQAALKAGLKPVKINMVLLKGINENEAADLLNFAFNQPLQVRFIEFMPIGPAAGRQPDYYLPAEFVLKKALSIGMNLQPAESAEKNGPADIYDITGGLGTVGLIHPVSRHFCEDCNRLRLTADGFLKPCLFRQEELPVRPALGDPEKIKTIFLQAVGLKHRQKKEAINKLQAFNMRGMSRTGG